MHKIFAAVRTNSEFLMALKSSVDTIFLLNSEILTLKEVIDKAHNAKKKIFIYFDFVEGLGKDKGGMKFLKLLSPDGIISVKSNIIKIARENDVKTIQRFFVVDSRAIGTAIEMIESAKPDMIEIMPGVAYKAIKEFSECIKTPVIAGGLIETDKEVEMAIASGAVAVSTGNQSLWR